MPTKYERKCNSCGNEYIGFGKFYCSSKCQPRNNIVTGVKGEKHGNWKGQDASYFAKHMWLNKWFGKADRCENEDCHYPRKNNARITVKEPKRYEWSLIKGREYTRNREDYRMLCKSCHAKYDVKKYA